jgi:MFS family permease
VSEANGPGEATRQGDRLWVRTLIVFTLVGVTEAFAWGHLDAFAPIYLRELGVPEEALARWVAVMPALGFIIGLPLLPFWGVWAEKYGRKIMIIRSSVAGALFFFLSAIAGDVWTLAAARLLSGLVLGNTGIMLAVQGEITPRDKMGTAVAVVSAGFPLGATLGPATGGLLVPLIGIRGLLAMDAAVTALMAVILALSIPEPPRPVRPAQRTFQALGSAIRAVADTPGVRITFLASFLLYLGLSAGRPLLPLLIEELYVGPNLPGAIGAILTIAGLAAAIGTPLVGRLGDRLGRRSVYLVAAALAAVFMLALVISRDLPLLTAAVALLAVAVNGGLALGMALIAEHAPDDRKASVLTLALLPQQLSWFLGPLSAAVIIGLGIRAVFAFGAITAALAGVVGTRLPRRPPGWN